MGGTGVSKSRASRPCADIGGRVRAFLGRPIEGSRPCLRIDATYLESREGGRIASVAAMAAMAVDADGRREVSGVATGAPEAEVCWTEFPRPLADRGPRGVRLVIADDHEGLRAAARRVLTAGLRRCRVHRVRGLPGHAAPEQRAAVAAAIRTILARDTEAEALARWDQVADALRAEHDRLGALAHADYPEEHRARVAGTNPLERVNKEVKRRADVAGILPNDEAVVRLVGALTLEQSDERAVGRRYLGLGSLARLADTDPHGPPASAA